MAYKPKMTDQQVQDIIHDLLGYGVSAPGNEKTPQERALDRGACVLRDFLTRSINCYDKGRQLDYNLDFRGEGDLLSVYVLVCDLEQKMAELRKRMERVLRDYRGGESCVLQDPL